MIRNLVFFIFLFYSSTLFSQNIISGKIIDHESGKSIVGANVYVNNTTIGVASNNDGFFHIANVPAGKQELVISFVGYEIISYSFTSAQLPLKIDFRLKQKALELNEIIIDGGFKVVSNDPYYWNWFLRAFIGNTPFSDKCFLKNKEDIELRFYEKKGTIAILKAIAKRPIIIINEALGYQIEYDLESFRAAGLTRNFTGKAYFKEINANKTSSSKAKLRAAAYYGSLTHFLRSIYHNTIDKEGFEVRSVLRKVNPEKEQYLKIISNKDIDKNKVADFLMRRNNNLFGDSSSIIRSIIFKPDIDIISNNTITATHIKSIDKSGNVILKSKDSLFSVTYTKPLANVMRRFVKSPSPNNSGVKSILKLKPNNEFIINPKINNVNTRIGFEGFFAQLYSISTMLPEDFDPELNR